MSQRGLTMSASAAREMVREMARKDPDFLTRNPHLRPSPPPVKLQERPLPATDEEDLLLAYIQALAKEHGWAGEHSVHVTDGVRCELVRGTDVLRLQLLGQGQALNAKQDEWKRRLEATGKVEVYVWRPKDRVAIKARLSAKEAH